MSHYDELVEVLINRDIEYNIVFSPIKGNILVEWYREEIGGVREIFDRETGYTLSVEFT